MRLKTALVFLALTLFLAQTGLAPVLPTFKPLEGNLGPLEAQFNPKELSINKSVPWTKTKKSTEDAPELEFTEAEPQTLAVELMFDTFESREDVAKKYGERLLQFATVDKGLKRPPMVLFTWGSLQFKGVIESLNVKYTMFLPDGTPVRATCDVKMKQADSVTTKKSSDNKD